MQLIFRSTQIELFSFIHIFIIVYKKIIGSIRKYKGVGVGWGWVDPCPPWGEKTLWAQLLVFPNISLVN